MMRLILELVPQERSGGSQFEYSLAINDEWIFSEALYIMRGKAMEGML